MEYERPTDADRELVREARATLHRLYHDDRHTVGAAVRTRDGRTFTGVNLDAYVSRADVCAEPIALGRAVVGGASGIETVVAVRQPSPRADLEELGIVSPCGPCRELIFDYGPETRVLIRDGADEVRVVRIADLLPHKFRRE